MELSYAFIIFFIFIGPLKVIPPFYMTTAKNTEGEIRTIAFRGVLYSFIIILFIGLIADQLLKTWKINLPAFVLAGGVLLFLSSVKVIMSFTGPKFVSAEKDEDRLSEGVKAKIGQIALSPVAIPIIISPIGIVAVVAALSIAHTYHIDFEVIGLIVAVMVLNFISMIFSRFIMEKIGFPVFSILGWVFAILQAGLAVQFIVNSLHKLFEFNI